MAVIIREGMRRMYQEQEDVFYYLTVGNENYAQPKAPDHLSREELEEGILRGLYLFRPSERRFKAKAQVFGSASIMNEALEAQRLLEDFKVAADVWSVTSYKELHRDALQVERENRLNPDAEPKRAYAYRMLEDADGVFVAASDYMKMLPDALARHLPKPMVALGTDGFGRSEAREELRDFFEVDARHIAYTVLHELAKAGDIAADVLTEARERFDIRADKPNPYVA
jgi:pyruvate dehydrogenase E1 component